jgi:bifunctional non-homologous end joining protein LigD
VSQNRVIACTAWKRGGGYCPATDKGLILKRARKPFDGGDWLFEIKHDGFRVMAIRDGGPTRLFTRNGYDISAKHPNITGQLNSLPARWFVIDGELVVLDGDGRSNFAKLMFGRVGTHYFAFDLLWLDKADLRPHPLERRKSVLQNLLVSCDPVRYCDHIAGCGKAFYETVREAGLEGMVAKRRRSAYRGGLTGDWLKVKCLRTHGFVVGGWIPHLRDSRRIRALLLGEFMDGTPHYVGKVDTGFDAKTRQDIGDALEMRADSPFEESIPEPDAVFCKPDFRVPIEFVDFTETGLLRRPVFSRVALF